MSWREEVRDRIAELEHMRLLLEETRISARNVGGAEGERLEAKVMASIRRLSNQIDDLRASLEEKAPGERGWRSARGPSGQACVRPSWEGNRTARPHLCYTTVLIARLHGR